MEDSWKFQMEIINSILLKNQNPEDRPTVLSILCNHFIQKWAIELNLKDFFPPEAKNPVISPELPLVPEKPYPTPESPLYASEPPLADIPPVDKVVQLFIDALLRDSPSCTPEQFRIEFVAANGRGANLSENTYFRVKKHAMEEKRKVEEEERRIKEEEEEEKARREREEAARVHEETEKAQKQMEEEEKKAKKN